NWRVAGIEYDLLPILHELGIEPKGKWKRQVELADLHERMLAPLRAQWSREQRIYDRYTTGGQALSDFEALPLYSTAHSLAQLAHDVPAPRAPRPALRQAAHRKNARRGPREAAGGPPPPLPPPQRVGVRRGVGAGGGGGPRPPSGLPPPLERPPVRGNPPRR